MLRAGGEGREARREPGESPPSSSAMEQRVSLITLGVVDLAIARDFYAALGWQGHEVEETVFFQAGGLGVVLWSREKLAADRRLAAKEAEETFYGGYADFADPDGHLWEVAHDPGFTIAADGSLQLPF